MFGGRQGEPTRYRMRQRLISLGDDFTITNDRGETAFHVDGKLLRVRDTFVMTDMQGTEVATIREKMLALRDSMHILRGGDVIATIRKAWFTVLRDKYVIDVKDGQDLVAQGDILDHEYEIRRDGQRVAEVSKHWFTIRDTYGISVEPGEDDGLILAIAVAIDEMAHDPDDKKQE